jgi:tRNA pseudouridine38/39 synthase
VREASPPKHGKNRKVGEKFDPSKYSTRLIALKFAYLGKRYNGFEHHAHNTTPLPTIEEELWKALYKCRLISPTGTPTDLDLLNLKSSDVSWEGCDYSKCGRTDKGVSAFGQVIGIRVRSNRPLSKRKASTTSNGNGDAQEHPDGLPAGHSLPSPAPAESELGFEELSFKEDLTDDISFNPVADEINYPGLLNHVLPPEIRILAWCPAPPPAFSARFSCRERQYKYFFTQPAFPPTPGNLEALSNSEYKPSMKDGWLDIQAMREAAKHYMGVHDFRNFCKIDPSKQITNFERRINFADIVEEDATRTLGFVNSRVFLPKDSQGIEAPGDLVQYPKVYSFTLHGSAFLWHQVRHMVAILFLVGQGLESPSVVLDLLDVEKSPCRPKYEMASDTPLVLWDCVFPSENDPEQKDALKWVYLGDGPRNGDAKYGSRGLMKDLWQTWRERKIDEVLAGRLIDVVAAQGASVESLEATAVRGTKSQMVFDGGDTPRMRGTYVPVMKQPLLEPVDTINKRYRVRKGLDTAAEVEPRRVDLASGRPDLNDE